MEWKPTVTVAAIIPRSDSFLLVEERPGDSLVINQPAGHLDEGESLLEAVVRETREETGWEVAPKGLVGVYRWQNSERTFIRFVFVCDPVRHYPDELLDQPVEGILWMSREDLSQVGERLRSPMVLRCVDDFLAGRVYPLEVLQDLG